MQEKSEEELLLSRIDISWWECGKRMRLMRGREDCEEERIARKRGLRGRGEDCEEEESC